MDNTKRLSSKNSKYPSLRKTFVPSGVLTRTGLITPVKQNEKRAVHKVSAARPVTSVRSFAPKIAQTSGATRPIYPRMDNVRPRGSYSPIKRSYYTKPSFRPKYLKQDVKTFGVQNMTTAGTRAVVNTGKGKMDTDLKKSRWVWRTKGNYLDHVSKDSGSFMLKKVDYVDPKGISKSVMAWVPKDTNILPFCRAIQNLVYRISQWCMVANSHMTGNKAYPSDYEDYNRGFVAFGSDPKGGKITGKGKIRTANLDFDDVYFVDELKFNIFSISQMCDKKNSVLFTETECLILSPSFKLLDKSQVVLRAPRKDDVYNLDLKNIIPFGGITCLYANATADESKLWHRRLGHLNFKNINKLVKGHLVKSVTSKVFVNITLVLLGKKLTKITNIGMSELEKMIAQEVVAKALDDVTRQAFEEEKRNIASQKRAAQTTSINKLSTGRSSVVLLPRHMLVLLVLPQEDDSDAFSSDGVFNGAYDDENVGDPKSAVQTRGKIQKDSSAQQALVEAMQEELLQFKLQKVWILVDLSSGKKAIGTKWVFKNKRDERSIVVKNKVKLIAQGFRQEEGIDYDEVFAPVARIEAIRLFLAFASYMGFTVYQMDVKSAFLYGTIEEEVYVHQPLGFVDPAYPNKVYKVIKALYGLHQAPRAWYETLSSFLMENGFRREFEDYMHKRFQMSSIGELTFFLGLQVKQQPDGIFISQDKYVADILKKFNFWSIRTASTPIKSNKPRSRYLKHQPKLGLWYPKDSSFELEAFSDKYVAAANCCGQVLWIQNQMMDYGFNFMNTRIHIDNESTISVIKNPVAHSRTKHIEIRFHFIRDCYEKRLIEVIKIHIDYNVADLLTKGFDVDRGIPRIGDGMMFIWAFTLIFGIRIQDGNAEFHEIIDFLTRNSIHYALTISHVVSTTFVEQFWMTAKSKTINNVRYITATVAGKPVSILEASIRSDLQFNDAAGIDVLSNHAIFDTHQIDGVMREI
ncbi:retrovirus-related pol polyprotein from transposon TNT 1-94 [Tanacetum coccineum]